MITYLSLVIGGILADGDLRSKYNRSPLDNGQSNIMEQGECPTDKSRTFPLTTSTYPLYPCMVSAAVFVSGLHYIHQPQF